MKNGYLLPVMSNKPLLFVILLLLFMAGCPGNADRENSSKQDVGKEDIAAKDNDERIQYLDAAVNHLILFVENSGYIFIRNGSIYTSKEAADHVRQKYDYLTERNQIKTIEDFIEKAASKSSVSGTNYLFRDKGGNEQKVGPWLLAEWKRYKEQGK